MTAVPRLDATGVACPSCGHGLRSLIGVTEDPWQCEGPEAHRFTVYLTPPPPGSAGPWTRELVPRTAR